MPQGLDIIEKVGNVCGILVSTKNIMSNVNTSKQKGSFL